MDWKSILIATAAVGLLFGGLLFAAQKDAAQRITALTGKSYTPLPTTTSIKNAVDFQQIENRIVTKITVNGKTGNFIIDANNPSTVIYEKFAKKNKITSKNNGIFKDRNNQDISKPICHVNLKFADKNINNVRAFILEDSTDFDGIIGSNVLHHLNYEIDYRNGKIIIYD